MLSNRREDRYADDVSESGQDAGVEASTTAVGTAGSETIKMFGDPRSALLTDHATQRSVSRRDVVEETVDGEPVKMFGDPRSALITRGPDRRVAHRATDSAAAPPAAALPSSAAALIRAPRTSRAIRLGGGDTVGAMLWFLGILVLIAAAMFGTLILVNARSLGAFSNPWNSNRVAIGLTVYALGSVHGALLIGVSRAITYHRAAFRMLSQVADQKNSNR